MHLWPSMKMRNSFKVDYLKQLEWSLHLLKLDKQRKQQMQDDSQTAAGTSGCQEKLLNGDRDSNFEGLSKGRGKFIAICRDLLLLITCCYCCFGCGAFAEDEEN